MTGMRYQFIPQHNLKKVIILMTYTIEEIIEAMKKISEAWKDKSNGNIKRRKKIGGSDIRIGIFEMI